MRPSFVLGAIGFRLFCGDGSRQPIAGVLDTPGRLAAIVGIAGSQQGKAMIETVNSVVIVPGEAIHTRWGQWYRHDVVKVGDREIGRIQTRRKYFGKRIGHRIETITLNTSGACVVGRQVEWLVSQAG